MLSILGEASFDMAAFAKTAGIDYREEMELASVTAALHALLALHTMFVKGAPVASLTIRNLEEGVKNRLRVQAASRGRSMEDEARHILRAALGKASPRQSGLGERIRERFAPLGDVQLPIATREPVREPVQAARALPGGSRAAPAPARRERRRG